MEKNDLIKLAKKIEDKGLQDKTIDLLKEFEITNKNIDCTSTDLEELPCWIGGHHYYEGGLLEHIYSVTKLCILMADHFIETYEDAEIDRDSLISAALLHDLAKQFIIKDMNNFRDCKLEHNVWMACELYARNFPEKIIDIIVEHGGEKNQATPSTIESSILHKADSMDAEMKQEDNIFGGSIIGLE